MTLFCVFSLLILICHQSSSFSIGDMRRKSLGTMHPSCLLKAAAESGSGAQSYSSLPSTDSILDLVADTDKGSAASEDVKELVNSWMSAKSNEYGRQLLSGKTALDDPNIYGNYDVAYVGVGGSQKGNPAGGQYRGFLGRFLYQNEGLYQHILKEEVVRSVNTSSTSDVLPSSTNPTTTTTIRTLAVNNVRGKLFRVIPLSVVLRGIAKQISEEKRQDLMSRYGTKLTAGAVRADFEPPFISLGGLTLQVGPPSSVVLDTPFVDDQVRLGVGSRGSTFIFARTDNPDAEKWKAELARKPLKGRRVGALLALLTVALNTLVKGRSLQLLSRVFSVPVGIVAVLLLLSKGGIIDEEEP